MAVLTETRAQQRDRLEKDRQRLVLRAQELRLAIDSYPSVIAVERERAIRSGDSRSGKVEQLRSESEAAVGELADSEENLLAVEKVLAELLAEDARERQAALEAEAVSRREAEMEAYRRFGVKFAELWAEWQKGLAPVLLDNNAWFRTQARQERLLPVPPHVNLDHVPGSFGAAIRLFWESAIGRNQRMSHHVDDYVGELAEHVRQEQVTLVDVNYAASL